MTTDTPGVDIDAARRLANRATGSPWTLIERQSNGRRVLVVIAEGHGEVHDDAMVAELPMEPGNDLNDWRNDGEFITRSRSLVPAMADELERYRDAVLHMLAHAPDEYRQAIAAARASASSEDYAKNNGRAEMIRTFATGLAERAGLPVTDWEQIKQSVPADGVYRAEAVAR